jgi:transcriptional regulator with XRE-family HTH domain
VSRSLSSSSVQQARQTLADRLREIRQDAGLTAKALAAAAEWHRTKISKLEHAVTSPSPDDIRTWCELCGAQDQAEDLIASRRSVEGTFIEWRRMERTGLRRAQQAVKPLYERTGHFRVYEAGLVPGLLQTRAYTAVVLAAIQRRRNLPDDVADAVAVRMERQRLLYEGDHRLAVLIEESVLRNGIGGADVMAGQLGHLLAVASLPSTSLGIIPAQPDRSAAWPVEGFWIFDDKQVNIELVSGYLTIRQPREIAMYSQVFAELAEIAVYGAEARARVVSALEALDN